MTQIRIWLNGWQRKRSSSRPGSKNAYSWTILLKLPIFCCSKDDLVQKGYGWMLKAANMSEPSAKGDETIQAKHLDTVFNFVVKNKSAMTHTALHYAIEKMSADLKAKTMGCITNSGVAQNGNCWSHAADFSDDMLCEDRNQGTHQMVDKTQNMSE